MLFLSLPFCLLLLALSLGFVSLFLWWLTLCVIPCSMCLREFIIPVRSVSTTCMHLSIRLLGRLPLLGHLCSVPSYFFRGSWFVLVCCGWRNSLAVRPSLFTYSLRVSVSTALAIFYPLSIPGVLFRRSFLLFWHGLLSDCVLLSPSLGFAFLYSPDCLFRIRILGRVYSDPSQCSGFSLVSKSFAGLFLGTNRDPGRCSSLPFAFICLVSWYLVHLGWHFFLIFVFLLDQVV